MNTYTCIYLSPHLDDAILSCGGRIWQQAQVGESVLVVTIFAAAPAPDIRLSPFAQELHTQWGHLTDAVSIRQEEDMAALTLLGAEAMHWPYQDCIYRQTASGSFPYASYEALWGEVHPTDNELVAELTARLAALPLAQGGTIYAPLGVGHHVDHQIVRRAVDKSTDGATDKSTDRSTDGSTDKRITDGSTDERITDGSTDKRITDGSTDERITDGATDKSTDGSTDERITDGAGYALIYYEDFPYAEDAQAVQAALGEDKWRAELIPLSQEAVEAKIAAIACYSSQLSLFWTGEADMAQAVRAFAERTGGGRPAERYRRRLP